MIPGSDLCRIKFHLHAKMLSLILRYETSIIHSVAVVKKKKLAECPSGYKYQIIKFLQPLFYVHISSYILPRAEHSIHTSHTRSVHHLNAEIVDVQQDNMLSLGSLKEPIK